MGEPSLWRRRNTFGDSFVLLAAAASAAGLFPRGGRVLRVGGRGSGAILRPIGSLARLRECLPSRTSTGTTGVRRQRGPRAPDRRCGAGGGKGRRCGAGHRGRGSGPRWSTRSAPGRRILRLAAALSACTGRGPLAEGGQGAAACQGRLTATRSQIRFASHGLSLQAPKTPQIARSGDDAGAA